MFGSHPAWITADAFFYFLEFFLKKISVSMPRLCTLSISGSSYSETFSRS